MDKSELVRLIKEYLQRERFVSAESTAEGYLIVLSNVHNTDEHEVADELKLFGERVGATYIRHTFKDGVLSMYFRDTPADWTMTAITTALPAKYTVELHNDAGTLLVFHVQTSLMRIITDMIANIVDFETLSGIRLQGYRQENGYYSVTFVNSQEEKL